MAEESEKIWEKNEKLIKW